MPVPLNPARMTGLARGLTLVEGGGNAARMRALVRKARATGAGTEAERAAVERAGARAAPADVSLDVYGPESYERTVARQPATRYSPTASAEQEMRTEAMRRHAKARPTTTYESPFAQGFPRDMTDAELRARGLDPTQYGGTEDPRSWFGSPDVPEGARPEAPRDVAGMLKANEAQLRRMAELRDKLGVRDEDMLRAFAERYGWAPKTWREAEVIISPADYQELLNGLTGYFR